MLLDRANLMRDGRLGEIYPFGRLGKVPGFGQGYEGFEVAQFEHG
jgi:hypothetical protein